MKKRNSTNNADNIVTKKDIGRNIKRLRSASGFTQKQVAKRAKMSTSHFGLIERGKADSTILTLYEISKALCVEIHKLFMKE